MLPMIAGGCMGYASSMLLVFYKYRARTYVCKVLHEGGLDCVQHAIGSAPSGRSIHKMCTEEHLVLCTLPLTAMDVHHLCRLLSEGLRRTPFLNDHSLQHRGELIHAGPLHSSHQEHSRLG
jgi:hypothetical protein